ncbi:hypothetical protein [Nocardia xishanensis]
MDKLTRNTLINSLLYEDTAALRVLDPDSAPRQGRRIATFNGQPEQQWINRRHVAWLAFVIYRLPAETDPAHQLVEALFDDPEQRRRVLAEAQAIADTRRTGAPIPPRIRYEVFTSADTFPGARPERPECG